MKFFGVIAAVFFSTLSLGLAISAQAADSPGLEVKLSKSQTSEKQERLVDEAALAAQEKAISTLQSLLARYRGHRQEPILLFKLAEVQTQAASLRFRIAHGLANRTGKSINLLAYKNTMKEAITSLDELIKKHPESSDLPRAYFMRGKAYEEIEEKPKAAQDYLHLVQTYPDAEEVTSAYMSLAQFSIDSNDHARAITYLSQIEKKPNDPLYPFALYKMAWSYFNLKDIAQALGYSERHVAYYNERKKQDEKSEDYQGPSTSDEAFRENMLLDSTVFFAEGFEQGAADYQVSKALPYFRKLDRGPTLGKMLSRFAKLLRSHGHELELNAWKSTVLAEEGARTEALDVLMITFENQINRRRFSQLLESSKDFVRLHKEHPEFSSWPQAEKLLLDTAATIQTTVVKNKNAQGVKELSAVLAGLYHSFTEMVPDTDPRVARVHYNLAEALFEIQDYDQATLNYRWIVDRGKWDSKDKEPGSVIDASLKAIGARYEELQAKKMIPGEIKARALSESRDSKSAAVEPMLAEWIGWVDEHVKQTSDPIENFHFEASRILYSQGLIAEAVDRMEKFAYAFPGSKFAIPSATLVLDTYVVSADWEKLHTLTTDFLKVSAWKPLPFHARLEAVAADAYYKTAESRFASKDYAGTLERAESFLKKYSNSARLGDTLFMAANAAYELKDMPKAEAYYTRLIREVPNAEMIPAALGRRALIAENDFRFAPAAMDYSSYLKLKSDDELRKKSLALAWLSGDAAVLATILSNPTICTEKLAQECDRYQALLKFEANNFGEDSTQDAINRAKKGIEENRTLWAAVALQGMSYLSFRERLSAVRQIGTHWDDLDGNSKLALIPWVSVSVPLAIATDRAEMDKQAPLRANPKYITARVDVIKEMESAATKAMKLPWSRVRATTLSEIAGLYLDLAKGLSKIPPPKGLSEADLATYESTVQQLVIPFEEKGQDMRGKAFEIAARFSIEQDAFNQVQAPYFADNPSSAQKLKPATAPKTPQPLDLTWLAQLNADGPWSKLAQNLAHAKKASANSASDLSSGSENIILERWAEAIRDRHGGQVAYFLQMAQEKNLVPPYVHSLMKAVSLTSLGARGEALAEVEDLEKSAPLEAKKSLLMVLLEHRLASLSRDKTAEIVQEWRALVAENQSKPQEKAVVREPATTAKNAKPAQATKPKDTSKEGQAIEAAAVWAEVDSK